MTDITTLATRLEAAKTAGLGITLDASELDGLLRLASLFGGGIASPGATSPDLSGPHSKSVIVDPDECLTTDEVCAKLRINRQTLYRWRKSGKFTPLPVNRQASRWLRSDVSRWLQEQHS